MTDLTPPDRTQCQALRPNKTWSPFAFGPAGENPVTGEKVGGARRSDRMWRCRNKPELIVTETKSDDGILGSMSVCKDCFIQLCLQRGGTFEVTEDLRDEK
jgi:hypothetical protein